MASPGREHWPGAIDEELASLKENETYKYVRRPSGRKTVRTKWVFKIKTDRDGKIQYKARLVILGYEQVWGIESSQKASRVRCGVSSSSGYCSKASMVCIKHHSSGTTCFTRS
jgi:hypothetical protein